jgi:hypothetical protein
MFYNILIYTYMDNRAKYIKYKTKYANLKNNLNLNMKGGARYLLGDFIDINLHELNVRTSDDFKFFSAAVEEENAIYTEAMDVYTHILEPNEMIKVCTSMLKNVRKNYMTIESEKGSLTPEHKFLIPMHPSNFSRIGVSIGNSMGIIKKALLQQKYATLMQSVSADNKFKIGNITVGCYYEDHESEGKLIINGKPSNAIKAIMNEYKSYVAHLDYRVLKDSCYNLHKYMIGYQPHILIFYEPLNGEKKYMGSIMYCINTEIKCLLFISIYKSVINVCNTCSETKFSKLILDQLTLTALTNDCDTIATKYVIGGMDVLLKQNGFIGFTDNLQGISIGTKYGLIEKDLSNNVI